LTSSSPAATFRLDVKGAATRQEFITAGIRPILIKGPALDRLLHGGSRSRDYTDIDLLIGPTALGAAEKLLATLRFRRFERESVVRQSDPSVGEAIGAQGAAHAAAWVRDDDSLVVDLHDSLPQIGVSPAVAWHELTRHIEVIVVAGEPTETLDSAATALLIALHAAHHGPNWSRAHTDLTHALQILDHDCWVEARKLASKLRAENAMGIGLSLNPNGRLLAERLSLPTEPALAHRLLWSGAPWSTSVLRSLMRIDSTRDRAAILRSILWPSPAAMRRGSALARRGPRGLVAAYLARLVQLTRALGLALRDLHARE
jgi:hypothetical protein